MSVTCAGCGLISGRLLSRKLDILMFGQLGGGARPGEQSWDFGVGVPS